LCDEEVTRVVTRAICGKEVNVVW